MSKRHKRGRYPDHFKKKIVAETFVKGASVAGVARRNDLNANMVFGWRKDARYIAKDVPPVFLPVEVGAADLAVLEPPSTQPTSSLITVDIELSGGHRLLFKNGIAPEALLTIVRGLAQ